MVKRMEKWILRCPECGAEWDANEYGIECPNCDYAML
jgi:DNA-directed RNA polymerase subunit RPC12/RpoP